MKTERIIKHEKKIALKRVIKHSRIIHDSAKILENHFDPTDLGFIRAVMHDLEKAFHELSCLSNVLED